MDKETFFIGNTNITIENPASYYPKTNKRYKHSNRKY